MKRAQLTSEHQLSGVILAHKWGQRGGLCGGVQAGLLQALLQLDAGGGGHHQVLACGYSSRGSSSVGIQY